MKTIIKIEHLRSWTDPKGKTHWKTWAIVDDGTEVAGYGKNFKVGDQVEVLYHKEWDENKMQHRGGKRGKLQRN